MPRSAILKKSPRRTARRPSVMAQPEPDPERLPGQTEPACAVVAVGASAGGLAALTRLLDALPDDQMAYVVIQHLDPAHDSLLADLLAPHTRMRVLEAVDGGPIEAGHVYVIPPGAALAVENGVLRVSPPTERHGARLPFDRFLRSLARAYGAHAIAVVLSGNGADGSAGARAVREAGGFVIVQDPDEAGSDGMPRSAIRAGVVDLVLRVADIPAAIGSRSRRTARDRPDDARTGAGWMSEIVELLRARTGHDFRLYKPGTLQRRAERRMAIAGIARADYIAALERDPVELDRLAKDLLINVTGFFRDPEIFDRLASTVVHDLVAQHVPDRLLRVWVAGCSTGEEAYSIGMLFLEAIAASKRPVKVQVFASDVDPEAVATAREGLYPEGIATSVAPERLARFFIREEQAYRVSPELRGIVIFTVQDVLMDPPFSRIDLVSCRNLLIYLRPESQERALLLFHFALAERGMLLLGSSETVGALGDRFEVVAKAERIYRRVGRTRANELVLADGTGGLRSRALREPRPPASQPGSLGDLTERALLASYAPASVLINHRFEGLYLFGRLDRYLRIAPGHPNRDLLAMAREGLRHRLRRVVQQAIRSGTRSTVGGAMVRHDGLRWKVGLAAEPVPGADEALILVSFVDEPDRALRPDDPCTPDELPRIAELERELESTREALHGAIVDLEASIEEEKGINEEAMSMNEEFQSTNEELVTSKEELQSLNEELTALNGQLQETLERQRSASNDLRNILDSSDVATLFLDGELRIRFFTPALTALFHVLPTDIGRPLSDFAPLASDATLLETAAEVLRTHVAAEREVGAGDGRWYARRIIPYRTHDGGVEGVVVTLAEITERIEAREALEAARLQAERANLAKSRFLAAVSHDLRQPLQTLSLLQGVLAKRIKSRESLEIVERLESMIEVMSGLLNTLLDINQLEAGVMPFARATFPVAELTGSLRDEFAYEAGARGIGWRVPACSLHVHSDRKLLGRIVRNLVANAFKYTTDGRVLLGCRRRGDRLRIEIWDSGPGIPAVELEAIFEEFHQLDNPARERSRGVGLGLSIVHRLAEMLGLSVAVRSRVGKGSMFSVEVPLAVPSPVPRREGDVRPVRRRHGTVLVVEDDDALREGLVLLLDGEGHRTVASAAGEAALAMVARGEIRPDLVIADQNLTGTLKGLQLVAELRRMLGTDLPAALLTGDTSPAVAREIAADDLVPLYKPVQAGLLTRHVQRLLARRPPTAAPAHGAVVGVAAPLPLFVVDDDALIRAAMHTFLEENGWTVESFASAEAFLARFGDGCAGCLIVDEQLPGMSGLALLRQLKAAGHALPSILITGHGDLDLAVHVMQAGARDFVQKPVTYRSLLASITRVVHQASDAVASSAGRRAAEARLSRLTLREQEVMALVLAGLPNKTIASEMGVSPRTVENHRAAVMRKAGVRSLPELVRVALDAGRLVQAAEPTA